MQSVSLKDIAEVVGVSVTTVSRVINGKSGVGEKTRREILAAADRLAYTPNIFARNLIKRSGKSIGVMVTNIQNPFDSDIILGVAKEAKERGYHIVWSNSFGDYEIEEHDFQLFAENQVDGILFHPVGEASFARLKKYFERIPTIVIGSSCSKTLFHHICTDNIGGGRMGAEYLIGCGCADLLYAGAHVGRTSQKLRWQGFSSAAKEHGIKCRVLRYTLKAEDDTTELAYEQFMTFAKNARKLPDGILAGNDRTAIGILRACDELGIRVPYDLCLMGFGNSSVASLPRIRLTTVAQKKDMLVFEAFNMLERVIDKSYSGTFQERLIKPYVIERDTCIDRRTLCISR